MKKQSSNSKKTVTQNTIGRYLVRSGENSVELCPYCDVNVAVSNFDAHIRSCFDALQAKHPSHSPATQNFPLHHSAGETFQKIPNALTMLMTASSNLHVTFRIDEIDGKLLPSLRFYSEKLSNEDSEGNSWSRSTSARSMLIVLSPLHDKKKTCGRETIQIKLATNICPAAEVLAGKE